MCAENPCVVLNASSLSLAACAKIVACMHRFRCLIHTCLWCSSQCLAHVCDAFVHEHAFKNSTKEVQKRILSTTFFRFSIVRHRRYSLPNHPRPSPGLPPTVSLWASLEN
jgi:hypothetical protein